MKYADSRGIILGLLSGGSAMGVRELVRASGGLNFKQVENMVFRCCARVAP